jgi:hypothetical protein
MKLTIAPLLLSPAFASKAGKLAKFSKAKAKAAKSAYGSSMSASMSFGPPPATLTGCGETFTNQKVVLSDNLNCGSLVGDQQQDCAVSLSGPKAEINCNDFTLSQVATPPGYINGPYDSGICLINGATAINCTVERFGNGIRVRNGSTVANSNLSPNWRGIVAFFSLKILLSPLKIRE